MLKNGKARSVTELESDLAKLNVLVRERRKQLARLESCPNKDCPCRLVWRDHVEKNLAVSDGKPFPVSLLAAMRRHRWDRNTVIP